MKIKHLFSTSALLLGLSSIVYGQLTGSDFLLERHFSGSIVFEFAVWMVLIFVSYGTAIYFLDVTITTAPIYKTWLLSGVFCLLPVGIFVFLAGGDDDWGKFLRFDIAPIAFYTLLGFSICKVFVKESHHAIRAINVTEFLVMAVCSFILGVGIFLAKSSMILLGNYHIGMQYLLSFLCLVLPLVSVLAAVRLKTLQRKSRTII